MRSDWSPRNQESEILKAINIRLIKEGDLRKLLKCNVIIYIYIYKEIKILKFK